MRLIDADALIERVNEIYPSACDNGSFWGIIAMIPTYDPPIPSPTRILTREELLAAEYDDLTPEEKERVRRCVAIPQVVVDLCTAEHKRLHDEVVEREKRMDTICDYLNGYDMTPEIPF